MFIAMNRFRVKKGSEEDFEKVWLSRDSHLDKVPGFVEFHLLRGPEHDDFTLYASHTIWQNRATFEAWTKSEASRTGMPARTSRSTSTIRSSKASRCARPWGAARPRSPSARNRNSWMRARERH
jgi:heme-degrading monooxygenase HmoA